MTPREAAVATVQGVLADHPDVPARRLAEHRWLLTLRGDIRLAIPVLLDVGVHTTSLTSFLLRGPRSAAAAELHRLLLRKNLTTHRLHLALDGDDDVVLVARLPTAGLGATEVEEALGEILAVSEGAFESLVHLAYPGVFPPLPRQPRPPVVDP
jgi:hypothetical protein